MKHVANSLNLSIHSTAWYNLYISALFVFDKINRVYFAENDQHKILGITVRFRILNLF